MRVITGAQACLQSPTVGNVVAVGTSQYEHQAALNGDATHCNGLMVWMGRIGRGEGLEGMVSRGIVWRGVV